MLNISKKMHVGWHASNSYEHDLPVAVMIPSGKSTNEQKKYKTLTDTYKSIIEIDNNPLPGFTLFKAEEKYYTRNNPTWLVIDPRGFLVPITSTNLEDILHVTGITEGLIQEKCVWAREDTRTSISLIPISSQLYVDAIENTSLLENKVNIKDVQIGDTVLLQNKMQGIYMGSASLYGPVISENDQDYYPQVFLKRHILQIENGNYYFQSDLKILKVINKTPCPMTRLESIEKMNKDIEIGKIIFQRDDVDRNSYYGVYGKILHVSTESVNYPEMTFEEIDKDTANAIYNEHNIIADIGQLIVVDNKDRVFLIEPVSSLRSYTTTRVSSDFFVHELNIDLWKSTRLITLKRKKAYIWSRSNELAYVLDDFIKFYKINKNVKSEKYI